MVDRPAAGWVKNLDGKIRCILEAIPARLAAHTKDEHA